MTLQDLLGWEGDIAIQCHDNPDADALASGWGLFCYLEAMGKKIMHCGGAGMGQRAKLANQAAIAGVMFSVCESLLFAQEAGLDVRKWHELVSAGAAGSVAMKTLGGRMLDGDFKPGFFIDHFVKDLGLILEECRRMGLILPGVNEKSMNG